MLKQVDQEKHGFVPQEVFFSLTDLHAIRLDAAAKSYLKKTCGKLAAQPMIDYKEALN